MNYLKVLAILSLLFIFCGSVYGAGEADSPDINGVNAVIDDTITVENASLTYDKLITSNNCEEVVIGDNSIPNSLFNINLPATSPNAPL